MKGEHRTWSHVREPTGGPWEVARNEMPTDSGDAVWDVYVEHNSGTRVPLGPNFVAHVAKAELEAARLVRMVAWWV